MASLKSDTSDSFIGLSSPRPQQAMAHGVMSELSNDYVLVHFHRFQQIKAAENQVFDALVAEGDGNQFIVILGLSESARQKLDSGEDCLGGISLRFMWENHTGLIKAIPTEHEITTAAIQGKIEAICRFGMGIARTELMFGLTTTRKPTVENKGKQSDNCFLPPSRQPAPGQRPAWPTLVLEVGVFESLRRLREDVHWWFNNSLGQVRTALIICINREQRK